jgi:hypothetical protein
MTRTSSTERTSNKATTTPSKAMVHQHTVNLVRPAVLLRAIVASARLYWEAQAAHSWVTNLEAERWAL